MAVKVKRYCQKCNSTKNEDNFYTSNNREKYPDGRLNLCKECLTMRVNNWEPDTYMWILQECDVPYVPVEWNKLLASYAKDPSTVTGMTIIGRYLAKMKLKQYNKFRWKDTDFLQQMEQHKMEEAMKKQGYDIQQIVEAQEKAKFEVPTEPLEIPINVTEPEEPAYQATPYNLTQPDYFDQQFGVQEEEDNSLVSQLTDEDKLMLRVKWGKTYKPDEWIQLEKLYNEMMESYDIQSAGHIDTLKMICKTSLKANQLLDMGDVDGAQKMVKMYDMLMKSGKFTAAQNKTDSGNAVDSIGELIAMCERDGFFPRYYTDQPMDKVDRTIQDLQKYTRTLITDEMNLGNLIEGAAKQIQADKEKEALRDADAAGDDDAFEAELFDEDEKAFLNDEDFQQLKDLVEDDIMDDEEYLASLIDDDDLI